jgi:hypothetical protein
MSQTQISGIQYFVIIAEQNKKQKFLTLLSEYGAHAVEVVYGRGSTCPSTIAEAFGFEIKNKKVIITCLLKNEKAKELIHVLYKKYKFEKPNTGFAFSITLEGLAF